MRDAQIFFQFLEEREETGLNDLDNPMDEEVSIDYIVSCLDIVREKEGDDGLAELIEEASEYYGQEALVGKQGLFLTGQGYTLRDRNVHRFVSYLFYHTLMHLASRRTNTGVSELYHEVAANVLNQENIRTETGKILTRYNLVGLGFLLDKLPAANRILNKVTEITVEGIPGRYGVTKETNSALKKRLGKIGGRDFAQYLLALDCLTTKRIVFETYPAMMGVDITASRLRVAHPICEGEGGESCFYSTSWRPERTGKRQDYAVAVLGGLAGLTLGSLVSLVLDGNPLQWGFFATLLGASLGYNAAMYLRQDRNQTSIEELLSTVAHMEERTEEITRANQEIQKELSEYEQLIARLEATQDVSGMFLHHIRGRIFTRLKNAIEYEGDLLEVVEDYLATLERKQGFYDHEKMMEFYFLFVKHIPPNNLLIPVLEDYLGILRGDEPQHEYEEIKYLLEIINQYCAERDRFLDAFRGFADAEDQVVGIYSFTNLQEVVQDARYLQAEALKIVHGFPAVFDAFGVWYGQRIGNINKLMKALQVLAQEGHLLNISSVYTQLDEAVPDMDLGKDVGIVFHTLANNASEWHASRLYLETAYSPEEGCLRCYVHNDGDEFDLDRIKETAITNGIKTSYELQEMEDEAIVQLIFLRGFTTRPDGTGRGLADAQDILRAYDGKISAYPSPMEGYTNCFEIVLPS